MVRCVFAAVHGSKFGTFDIRHSVLPVIWLKPDAYGFGSMKMADGRGFLVININCLILINGRKIELKLFDKAY